jgi:hypothetical protein
MACQTKGRKADFRNRAGHALTGQYLGASLDLAVSSGVPPSGGSPRPPEGGTPNGGIDAGQGAGCIPCYGGPLQINEVVGNGHDAEPGVVPGQTVAPSVGMAAAPVMGPLVLDARPIFARGESPCSKVDEAVASLAPGQSFVLLAPKEPKPLFDKLGALGFSYHSEAAPDGGWRVEFTPGATPTSSAAVGVGRCSCH